MTESKPVLLYIKITDPKEGDKERAEKILKLWKENFEVVEVKAGERMCCSHCDGTGMYEFDGETVCCSYCDGCGTVPVPEGWK
jgi:DnaJ-class molecular chaperone